MFHTSSSLPWYRCSCPSAALQDLVGSLKPPNKNQQEHGMVFVFNPAGYGEVKRV